MRQFHHVRGVGAVGAAAALALAGLLGASPSAQAADPLITPTITVATYIDAGQPATLDNLTPVLKDDGSPNTTPQIGYFLVADPGGLAGVTLTNVTYQWGTWDDAALSCAAFTGRAASTSQSVDYIPVTANIGHTLCVTVTARATGYPNTTVSVPTADTVVGLNPAQTTAPVSGQPWTADDTQTGGTGATPQTVSVYWTWYGYPDNTPPSADISYSVHTNTTYPNHTIGHGIHVSAGGTGTYEDPISFATSPNELTPGTEIYVPQFGQYYIMEDSCTECGQDMSGQRPNNPDGTIGPGPDDGPAKIHFDLWIGGDIAGGGLAAQRAEQANWVNEILCEDALTTGDFGDVILNPGPGEPVSVIPPFDPVTGLCYNFGDNEYVSLGDATMLNQYQNITGTGSNPNPADDQPQNGTGLCITDPGNSAVVGTQLIMEACDGTMLDGSHDPYWPANQNLSYVGDFLLINNLCLSMGDQYGNPDPGIDDDPVDGPLPVTLQLCNMSVTEQWEGDDGGPFSDIQTSNWQLSDTGNSDGPNGEDILMATYSGGDTIYDDSYWGLNDPIVNGTAESTSGGIQIIAEGLTTPTARVYLTDPASDDVVADLGIVTADQFGKVNQTLCVPTSVAAGAYTVAMDGLSGQDGVIPADTAIVATSQLATVGGDGGPIGAVQNFQLNGQPVNLTVPIAVATDDDDPIQIAAGFCSGTPGGSGGRPGGATAPTGGSVAPAHSGLASLAGLLLAAGLATGLVARRQRATKA